jgi:hypothetical protein
MKHGQSGNFVRVFVSALGELNQVICLLRGNVYASRLIYQTAAQYEIERWIATSVRI